MSTGTIQGSFGWDNAPFVQGMAEAERVATRGAGNIQSKFTGLFKRGPGVRAEHALSGFFERVAAGDIAGGIESISSKMTGLGLIAGVAVAAGVAIFVKFKQEIDATNEAAKALGKTLALPTGAMGAEEISKRFAEVAKQTDDLTTKSQAWGSKIGNFFASDPLLGQPSSKQNTDKEIISGLREEASLLDKRAAADAIQLAFKERILGVGAKQAQIEKLNYDLSVKQSTIDEESTRFKLDIFDKVKAKKLSAEERDKLVTASEESANARKQTAKDETDLGIYEVKQKEAVTERSVRAQERFAKLASSDLTKDQQKKLKESIELRGLDEQIKTEADPLVKRSLIAQKRMKEHEMGIAPGDVTPLSGEWWRRKHAGEALDVQSALEGTGLTPEQIAKFGADSQQLDSYGNPVQAMNPNSKVLYPGGAAGKENAGVVDELGKLQEQYNKPVVDELTKLRTLFESAWGK